MMQKILLTLIAGFFLGSTLNAAEPELDIEEADAESGQENSPVPDIPASLDDLELEVDILEASDENFVPSIRITEDLPVAFPVDI